MTSPQWHGNPSKVVSLSTSSHSKWNSTSAPFLHFLVAFPGMEDVWVDEVELKEAK